jgi:hypothetical protein
MNRKQFVNNSNFSSRSQSGVTLLLSIIVLASITAISFSIATIMLVEIRTSGDLLKTEPAISAAEALGEEALFKIKRNLSSYTYSSQVGTISVSTPTESLYNDPIQQDKILPTSYSFTNTVNHYTFYDPTDISGGSGYSKLRLTYIDTGHSDNLSVYICQYDPINATIEGDIEPVCSDPSVSNSYWLVGGNNVTVTPTTDVENREWILDPAKQQELILVNTSGSNTIYFQIETFVPDGPDADILPDPKGIPYFGEKSVEVTAVSPGLSRKIRVIVPNSDSFSGGASGYEYNRAITFDFTKVPNTDLTNFPALIKITDPTLKTVANGGNVEDSNGYDIVFSSNAAGTSFLNWEMKSYNGTTGSLTAWVQVPTLSHTANTTIYMFYGNDTISNFQSLNSPWGSNYKGIWHLDEAVVDEGTTADAYQDSTLNDNDGDQRGSDDAVGQISNSQDFDGANDIINVGDTASLDISTSAITLSGWIYDDATTNMDGFVMGKVRATQNYYLFVSNASQAITIGLNTTVGGFGSCARPGGVGGLNFMHNRWNHVVGTYDGTNMRIYLNGTQRGTACPKTGTIILNNDGFAIGDRGMASANNFFDGLIDEVHVSNTALSADWIMAEYNNQYDPTTFYTVGPEQ